MIKMTWSNIEDKVIYHASIEEEDTILDKWFFNKHDVIFKPLEKLYCGMKHFIYLKKWKPI